MLLQRRAPLATTSSLPGRQFAFRRSCCPQAAAQMDAATCEDLAVPTTFQRLIARKTGQSFREVAEIDTVSMIKLDKGQVLIKVLYAGVNGGCETFRARGEFVFSKNKKADQYLLGAEGTGIVAAVSPDVKDLQVGQHVTCAGSGAFAEYVTASAASCTPVRQADAQIVAVSLSGLTAAGALEVTAGMSAGQTVLITAAAGATGHFGVQLAKLAGCHVIATVGSAEKAGIVQELGADRVINYHEEDPAEVLAREYPGKIDIAYEGVGGPLRDAVVDNLAAGGHCLAVGYIGSYSHTTDTHAHDGASTSGRQSNGTRSDAHHARLSSRLPPPHELMWTPLTVDLDGRTIHGNVWPKDRGALQVAKQRLFDRYYEGKIRALVDDAEQFNGVSRVCDAVDYMLSGKAIGKVVVRMHSSAS